MGIPVASVASHAAAVWIAEQHPAEFLVALNVERQKRGLAPTASLPRRSGRYRSLDWLRNLVADGDRTTGCWIWPFGQMGKGYGQLATDKGPRTAHVMALILSGSPRPLAPRNHAIHSCDNPICVNPAHLRWGTNAENVAEMVQKGRVKHGEQAGNARLTAKQVEAIWPDPRSNASIARDFGVSESTIRNIKKRRTWKHVTAGNVL